MTQAKSSDLHSDTLIARYRAAQTELDTHAAASEDGAAQHRPSAHVRVNILAHAAQLAHRPVARALAPDTIKNIADYVHSTGTMGIFGNRRAAANNNQWKIRALASVAILGLTSLLFMQWDRSPPEEKEVAFNMERTAPALKAPVPVPVPVPAPVPAPSAPGVTAPSKPAPNQPQAQASPPAITPISKPLESTTEVLVDRSAAPAAVATEASPAAVAPPSLPSPAPVAARAAKSLDSATNAPQAASIEAAPARLMSPNAALFAAIREADAVSMQLALTRGADKNAKSNGTPALTLCVQSNQVALVRQLAAAGADLNAPDTLDMSPLAHARAKGLDAMVRLLLELGAK
jgi:hypothetical protein